MLLARDIVLLLTHGGDFYTVDRVAQELSRRGASPLRINTEDFPTELELTTALGRTGEEVVLRMGTGELRGEEVRAVWARRLALPRLDEALEPAWRDGCMRESLAAFDGFLAGLEALGCRFINPIVAGQSANNAGAQGPRRAAGGSRPSSPSPLAASSPSWLRPHSPFSPPPHLFEGPAAARSSSWPCS
jgi:hypothetical protein